MKQMKKMMLGAALAVGALFTASPALADGLMANPGDLTAQEQTELQSAIAAHKAKNPAIYEQVRNVKGYQPEVYKKFRNPIPLVGGELRKFGPEALLPMLEALAFDMWERGDAEDHEWRALKVGMLEAVGSFHDARSTAVVTAAFDNAQHVDVQSAAAKAVGSVCGKDASVLSTLSAALKTSKRLAAIDGLGECRIAGAAQTLADQLGKTKNAKEADRIARALGMLGSSWAWRAIENTEGKARGKEGLEARRIATEALVDGFARFDKARRGHLVGLSMVQYPGLRGIAEQRRGSIDPGAFAQLERIVERVEQRNSR